MRNSPLIHFPKTEWITFSLILPVSGGHALYISLRIVVFLVYSPLYTMDGFLPINFSFSQPHPSRFSVAFKVFFDHVKVLQAIMYS